MELLVEIVDFYPERRKGSARFMGTLHVYVIINGVQMDLRGLPCYRNKDIYIFIPDFTAIDEGEKVRYPMFNLTDHDLHKKLMVEIVKKGREFIKQKQKDEKYENVRKPNPVRQKHPLGGRQTVRSGAGQKP